MSTQSFNITCPNCKVQFPLTETLAKPFIDTERAKVQQEAQERAAIVRNREQEVARREKAMAELKNQLDTRQAEIDAIVAAKLQEQREPLAKAADKKAADEYAAKLLAAEQELAEKQAKLAETEDAELALRKERRALEEEKHRLELEIERRLQGERLSIREATQKEEQETYRLKLAEKDKILADLKTQVEELRRKSDQGSQQLQGEVQELELEAVLRAAFPNDGIEGVLKGCPGGDVVHTVVGPSGQPCGKVLWESKRTKRWSDEWLAKNREDQRLVGAHIGVIVTAVMPRGIDGFDRVEGVWIAGMRYARPLAIALRQALIEVTMAKIAAQGREGKMELIYAYLTGPHFRQRVSAILEAGMAMQKDLDAEKRVMTKQWAKRQCRLDLMMRGTAGMYGDLQGIVGGSMPEVQGLNVLQLGDEVNSTATEAPDNTGDAGRH
jgi:hypothetical protein